MAEPKELRIGVAALQNFGEAAFAKVGCGADEARLLTEILVLADLHGMHSHGVMRIPQYGPKIAVGGFKPGRKGRIVRETASAVFLDGEGGIGQTITVRAMQEAMRKARETGVGICGVTNSNHYGAGAYYGLMAEREGMIGVLTTNGSANMPPYGGGGKIYLTGPLPITVAVPTGPGSRWPFLLDMAMGVASKGKIVYAAEKGEKIPLGWAADKHGQLTDDPKAVINGGWVLPIGGYKGFGLTCVLEILSGVLTGGALGNEIGNLFTSPAATPQDLGHFAMAIDPAVFMPLDAFRARMDIYIAMMKAADLAPGVEEITMPGEPEFRREEDRRRNGVPLDVNLIARLNKYAAELGIGQSL
jgi:LDH2 family malate/lactate/ureidoglycolate dehydrogenase